MNRFNFLIHQCVCSNLNAINLKLFLNHGGIYRFRKKFKKGSGEINPLGVHRTRVVIDHMFAYDFVDPSLRVEIIFRKARTAETVELILK